MGIQSVVSLAPFTYQALAARTKKLTASLPPSRLRELTDGGITSATSAWIQLVTNKSAELSPATSPIPPVSPVQRIWDNLCCKVQADQVQANQLFQTGGHMFITSYVLVCRRHGHIQGSSDRLNAMPLSSIGLKLDNASVRITYWSGTWFTYLVSAQVHLRHNSPPRDIIGCHVATVLDVTLGTIK